MSDFAEHLHQRLEAVRRQEDRATILQSLSFALLALLGMTACTLIAEQAFYMPSGIRKFALLLIPSAAVITLAWRGGRAILRLLRLRPHEGDEQTARRVGYLLPGVEDKIVNALQLATASDSGKIDQLYSRSLVDAALKGFQRDLEPIKFSSIVNFAGSRSALRMAGIAAGVLLALFLVAPASFLGSAYRLLHTGEIFAAPVPFHLLVEPGNKEIIKGESVNILVRVVGAAPEVLTLVSRPEGETADETRTLVPSSDGDFRFEFPALGTSTRYAVRAGDVRSEEYMLTVVDRPLVRVLRVAVQPPAYTGMPAQQLDDNTGDVTGIKGSRITFQVESNKELQSARLVFADSTSIDLRVSGTHATGEHVAMRDGSYHVALRDVEKIENIEPVEYSIRVLPDAYPSVTILSPGANLDVTDNSIVPVTARISDDFGFNRLRLAFKLVRSRYEEAAKDFSVLPMSIPPGTSTEAIVGYQWPLEKLRLAPEDVVSYYLEVFDNDKVSGPKSSVSETYTLRLPSLEEVFADVDKTHESSLQDLHQSLDEAKQARQDMQDLLQETRTDKQKLDWQDQKKAEQLSKKYEEIQKQLGEVQKNMDHMLQEMNKNKVLSQETMEKYMELQQLMEQMNSPEFAEAMKQFQQAMQQVSPEDMRKAIEKFSFSEESFRKNIERTMNLLKRIQIEQKLDQAVKQMEELQKNQEDLHHETSSMNPDDSRKSAELARKQQDMKQKAEQSARSLQDLQKKMEEFPSEMPLSEMESVNKEMAESKLDEQMSAIGQQLSEQQQSQAMQGQQQAMQEMAQLRQHLETMKQSLHNSQQQQVLNAMRRDIQDLLDLSKREETLKNDSRKLEQNSPEFRRNAEQQMDVMNDLNRVGEHVASLSEKFLVVTPDMGKALGEAERSMAEAMRLLEQRIGGPVAERQEDAMASLNQGAELMQGAMQAMQQSGGQGMGMTGFLQRLRQLSGQQEGINQGTQQAGGMSQEQAAAMARLAAEQGTVRKSLEDLKREAAASGDLSRMLGDLTKITEDMREVQTDLAQNNVNPETVQKQDRILSRLLDAQRSTRERDFEQKRRSQSGQDVVRKSPGAIDLTSQEGKDKLRRDLLRALEQGYTPDYEDLIRKYFDALEQAQ